MSSIEYTNLLGWGVIVWLVLIAVGLLVVGGLVGYCMGFKAANSFWKPSPGEKCIVYGGAEVVRVPSDDYVKPSQPWPRAA